MTALKKSFNLSTLRNSYIFFIIILLISLFLPHVFYGVREDLGGGSTSGYSRFACMVNVFRPIDWLLFILGLILFLISVYYLHELKSTASIISGITGSVIFGLIFYLLHSLSIPSVIDVECNLPNYECIFPIPSYGYFLLILGVIGCGIINIKIIMKKKRFEEYKEIRPKLREEKQKRLREDREQREKERLEKERKKLEKIESQRREEEKESLKKIKTIVEVSDRIEIEMMRKSLGISESEFLDKIYGWAKEFNFRIDGNQLIINQNTIGDFLDALDKQFDTWERREGSQDGKI